MTIPATITQSWSSGGTVRSGTITRSAGLLNRYGETIPGDSTDLEVACVIDVSELKALYMFSARAMTVKTNNPTDDTINLAAGEPLAWAANNGVACPLTVDVTALFIDLAVGADSVLIMEVLVDPTP
jgi:hypothetical protein